MGKRGKRNRGKVTLPNNQSYDRRATKLSYQGDFHVISVVDPFAVMPDAPAKGEEIKPPKTIDVVQNLRDDPLAWLLARRYITNGQFMAGRQWQRWYESAQDSGSRGMDYTRPKVDGHGAAKDLINDRRRKAIHKLLTCRRVLGVDGDRLIRQVLGERWSFEQVANQEGMRGDRYIRSIGYVLRRYLRELAKSLGYEKETYVKSA